jgi:hypothetical protein
LDHVAVIEFSLSVKDALELVVVRDHPSGIFTEKWPFEDRYVR